MKFLSWQFALHRGPMFLLLAALLVSVGCAGKQKTTITGTVTYKGRPVTMGAIYFHGPNDQVAMGTLQQDGSFTATDVPVGDIKVTVVARDAGAYGRDIAGGGAAPVAKLVAVPVKYADAATSGLVYPIKADTTKLDVKLD